VGDDAAADVSVPQRSDVDDSAVTLVVPPSAPWLDDPSVAVPQQHPAMDTSYLDNEAVVFDERSAVVHRLNPSATLVWTMCDGETSIEQMLAELAEAFGLPPEAFAADVRTALDSFWDEGMLTGSVPVVHEEILVDAAKPQGLASGLFVLADAGEP
jgi:PqqD family protein of HPr-rel-A system